MRYNLFANSKLNFFVFFHHRLFKVLILALLLNEWTLQKAIQMMRLIIEEVGLLNSTLQLVCELKTWLSPLLLPSQAHQSRLSYLISEELSHGRPFNDEEVTCDQLWSKLSILISRQKTHQMHQLCKQRGYATFNFEFSVTLVNQLATLECKAQFNNSK